MIKRTLRSLFILLAIIIFAAFSIANRQMVEISFMPVPYSISMPLFLLTIACFALGILAAWLLLSGSIIMARRDSSKAHKHAMALENELKGLRLEQETISARTALVQKRA